MENPDSMMDWIMEPAFPDNTACGLMMQQATLLLLPVLVLELFAMEEVGAKYLLLPKKNDIS